MSWVSEIKDICGDYYIDVKHYEEQKEAITLFFNSRRNAEIVKRCIEVDDSVPNVATAVDFVEVKHGEWIKRTFIVFDNEIKEGYHCSVCNTTWDTNTNFCPNCGAKMDGGKEE